MNIQIFGLKKCFDTKKAERYFKERCIKYQFIDLKEKGMSKGEYNSVKSAVGGHDNLIDLQCKDKDLLALIQYIAEEDKDEKDSGKSEDIENSDCAKWKAGDSWISTRHLEELGISL